MRQKSTASCLRRCPLLGISTVLFVSKTEAKFFMMHARDPGTPMVEAISSFTSISQRTKPFHQLAISSVGQMRALIKSKNRVMTIQKTRPAAAKLRFLTCQIKGGISIKMVMHASTGTTMAYGEVG